MAKSLRRDMIAGGLMGLVSGLVFSSAPALWVMVVIIALTIPIMLGM
jgi:hypothetical protein